MKEQVLPASSSCHVVVVTQEDASKIGRCKGAPIRSGVSSELATELLPASPGRLINCKTDVLSGAEWMRHLEQVRRYHPCTCTGYDGTTFVRVISVKEKTGISQVYHLQVQGWYRRTS